VGIEHHREDVVRLRRSNMGILVIDLNVEQKTFCLNFRL